MDSSDAVAAKRSTVRGSKEGGTCNLRRIYNTIYFSDKINHDTAHQLIVTLKNCELDILEDMKVAEDSKKPTLRYAVATAEPTPIELYLTTYGGLVHAAFAVVDVIRSLRVPVHTIVLGYVASAGTLISLAGTKRFITPNSFMMIHEIRGGFWGKFSEARTEYENVTKLMDHVTRYYLEKTPIHRDRLVELLRKDTDINATESLEMGLVSEIR